MPRKIKKGGKTVKVTKDNSNKRRVTGKVSSKKNVKRV